MAGWQASFAAVGNGGGGNVTSFSSVCQVEQTASLHLATNKRGHTNCCNYVPKLDYVD